MKSRRCVASASTSIARRERSAVRISAPTAASALTAVRPTIVTAATASNSVKARLSLSRIPPPAPWVDQHHHRPSPAAHEPRIGERRAGGTKHVDEPVLGRYELVRGPELQRPLADLARAEGSRR